MAPATAATSAETPTNPPGLVLIRAAPVCEESLVGTADAGMGKAMVSVVVKISPEPSEPEPLPELPESEPEPEPEPEPDPDELLEPEEVDSLPLADEVEELLPDDEPPEAVEAPDADVEVEEPLPDPLALPLPLAEPDDVLVVNDVLVTTELPLLLLVPLGSEGWSERTMNLKYISVSDLYDTRSGVNPYAVALELWATILGNRVKKDAKTSRKTCVICILAPVFCAQTKQG